MSNGKKQFLSIENMKLCETTFRGYMLEKFNFDIITDGKTTNVRKLLFDVMNDINEQYASSTQVGLKDMNNITLNIARDFYKSNYKINVRNEKATIQSLEREQNLYGPRILNYDQIKPEASMSDSKITVPTAFSQLESQRKQEQQNQPSLSEELKPILETAYDPDEFLRKLSELEQRRGDVQVQDLTALNTNRLEQDTRIISNMNNDPKVLYKMTRDENKKKEDEIVREKSELNSVLPNQRQAALAPQITQMILLDKYLAVNGFDRNWHNYKQRFNFRVDFNFGGIQNRYRNIKSIKATRVIVPMEISEVRTIANNPKPFYNHEFSFSYPFLTLNIDEFGDVYDGTNENVKRCFCHLIFDKCYKSPNGRGYIVLNPMQNESKVYHPTPLSGLSSLSISIRRPNGTLFNNSSDEYMVFKVEYELYNKHFLKIVTDKYFDKNEFFRGDTILVSGYEISKETSLMSVNGVNKMNEFINRKEGHEILEIGQANDQGFFRNFYINAPGLFNTDTGTFVIENEIIDNLNAYNDTIDFSSWTNTNGSIINTSLQCTIAFKLQTVATDPGIVDTSFFSSVTYN